MPEELFVNPNLIGRLQIGSQEVSLFSANLSSPDSNPVRILQNPSDDQNLVIEAVKKSLIETNWWLNTEWEQKGLPKEQVEFVGGNNNVTLYNYGNALKDRHLQEIAKVLGIFSGIKDGKAFENFRYLLINDEQPINSKSGLPENGYAYGVYKAIRLNPSALVAVPNRVTSTVSNLEGTLAHELAHHLVNINTTGDVVTLPLWKKVGSWRALSIEERKVFPGGLMQYEICDEPERCVTDYARFEPEEDLCESMVAFLFDPKKLDPERLKFLREHLPYNPNESKIWTASLVPTDQIKLPLLPSEIGVGFLGSGKNRFGPA